MRGRLTACVCLLASGLALGLAGCQTIGSLGAAFGVATGTIDTNQAASIQRTAQAVQKSFEDITPEQEYYIGRAVAAVVLDSYPPYQEEKVNGYLNLLGQSLALASERPETFGGYHFLALDSQEINAFAAPGGLILVARGLLRCAGSEDEVAAILAHEIAHVAARHGLQAIKKSRITTALTSAALTGAQLAAPEEMAKLTQAFEDSIQDITSTLINNGYSREFERQADAMAVEILKGLGYNPWALVRVLQVMETRMKPGGPGFAKTHPDPKDRIRLVERQLAGTRPAAAPDAKRQRRYQAALAGI